MTKIDLEKAAYNFLISLGGVMLMAALQSAVTFLASKHPEVLAGTSQLGAAFTAIKFFGR